jgi:succinate dehydrogenase/fumarate reductase flavoprotein subunit
MSQKNDLWNCNRRDFMKYAGIGAAAMSVGGMVMASNVGAASMANLDYDEYETDVLIIGGGLSATFAAVKARAAGAKVTVVDKGYAGRSGLTPWFHGFAYFDPKTHTREEWHHGLMWATEGISRADYIDLFLDDSAARSAEICEWVPRTSLPQSKGPHLRTQIEKSGANIIDGVMITELLEKDGRIVGAIGIPRHEDKAIVFKAGAVILCTGAGTFKSPGWPCAPNTFDGTVMAYKAGAEIAGKEWNDFHMTSMETPTHCWGNHGGSFSRAMTSPTDPEAHSMRMIFWSSFEGVDPEGPDIGAAPTSGESEGDSGARPSGGPSDGDSGARPSGGPSDGDSAGGPPGADSAGGEAAGARSPMARGQECVGSALGAAEHRMDGVFPRDTTCGAGIDGLYAAGDAMCTGGVGTAGISSPGGAVQGARAGTNAAEYARKSKRLQLSKSEISEVQKRIFKSREQELGYSPQWVTRALRNIMMPYYVLYVKRQDRLEAALANVLYLKEHFVPRLIAKDTHELRLALETENMIINAEMKLRASMFRKESRHSHFREDYPFRDDKNFLSFVLLKKNGENMDVSKWDIPKKWYPESYSSMPYEEKYTDRYPTEAEYLKKHKL